MALDIQGVIQVCQKFAVRLEHLKSAFENEDTRAFGHLDQINKGWIKFMLKLNFWSCVQHNSTNGHREIHEQILRVLATKMDNIVFQAVVLENQMIIDRRSRPNYPKKTYWDGSQTPEYESKKKKFLEAIKEFKTWQEVADCSWFLVFRINTVGDGWIKDKTIGNGVSVEDVIPETRLVRQATLPNPRLEPGIGIAVTEHNLNQMHEHHIQFSSSTLAGPHPSDATKAVYLLSKIQHHPLASYHDTINDAGDLAKKLQHGNPTMFSLLDCQGLVVPSAIPSSAAGVSLKLPAMCPTLVFRLPARCSEVLSLRDRLLYSIHPACISERIEFARDLAKAVSALHFLGIVHMNIRPESILSLLVERTGDDDTLTLHLFGFENFGRKKQQTLQWNTETLDQTIYSHPSLQNGGSQEYNMKHDIYSLGVCLLEIGFWKSIITYKNVCAKGVRNYNRPLCVPTGFFYGGDDNRSLEDDEMRRLCDRFTGQGAQRQLVFLAQIYLPAVMGPKYTEVVTACLTCLDADNEDFGHLPAFASDNGVRLGVKYIEKVLFELNNINV